VIENGRADSAPDGNADDSASSSACLMADVSLWWGENLTEDESRRTRSTSCVGEKTSNPQASIAHMEATEKTMFARTTRIPGQSFQNVSYSFERRMNLPLSRGNAAPFQIHDTEVRVVYGSFAGHEPPTFGHRARGAAVRQEIPVRKSASTNG
jgi:hypothetical protein